MRIIRNIAVIGFLLSSASWVKVTPKGIRQFHQYSRMEKPEKRIRDGLFFSQRTENLHGRAKIN